MPAEKILKGVYDEGGVIASIILKDGLARIMVKGLEPEGSDDPAFLNGLKKVMKACAPHVKEHPHREVCAVLSVGVPQAETLHIAADELQAMELQSLTLMDGGCGIVVRVCEAEPPPVPLPYTALRADSGLPNQPGMVDLPETLMRKSFQDLTPSQRKVFEAAAQVAGRALIRIVCFEDGALLMAVTVKDLPPPRARSILVPMDAFARDLEKGVTYEEIGTRLQPLRA